MLSPIGYHHFIIRKKRKKIMAGNRFLEFNFKIDTVKLFEQFENYVSNLNLHEIQNILELFDTMENERKEKKKIEKEEKKMMAKYDSSPKVMAQEGSETPPSVDYPSAPSTANNTDTGTSSDDSFGRPTLKSAIIGKLRMDFLLPASNDEPRKLEEKEISEICLFANSLEGDELRRLFELLKHESDHFENCVVQGPAPKRART